MFKTTLILVVLIATSSRAARSEPERDLTLVHPTPNSVVVFGSDRTIDVDDGDSFSLGGLRLRLFGIDAVEKGQSCKLVTGQTCFEAARVYLSKLLKSENLTCRVVQRSNGKPWVACGGRYVAKCSVGGDVDQVNRLMLSSGLAFADYKKRDLEYVRLVDQAKQEQRGIHASADLEHPGSYRRRVSRNGDRVSDAELLAEVKSRWGGWSKSFKISFGSILGCVQR